MTAATRPRQTEPMNETRRLPTIPRPHYVYIVTNRQNGTLYTGSTADLIHRVWQHRQGIIEGFSKRYGTKRLVWYEEHTSKVSAFGRERAIKRWNRAWKIELIESANPEWRDLYDDIVGASMDT